MSNVKIDVQFLKSEQIRLLKRINSLMLQNATTQDNQEYFESCRDLVKVMAQFMQSSHLGAKETQGIEYAFDSFLEEMPKRLCDH